MLYICTKLYENICNGFKTILERTSFQTKNYKQTDSVNNVDLGMKVISIVSDDAMMLYICTEFPENNFLGFQDTQWARRKFT